MKKYLCLAILTLFASSTALLAVATPGGSTTTDTTKKDKKGKKGKKDKKEKNKENKA